jgi:thioredoxin 1
MRPASKLDPAARTDHFAVQAFFRRQRMSANTVAVTDETFETDVLKASGPVLVDFWAEWCGPCKMIAPALEEIGAEYQGRVTVAKVNIDENPTTPNTYGVRGIPTLILFKDGKPAATKVGAAPKSALKEWVSASLDAAPLRANG